MFWSGRPDLNRGPPAPKAGVISLGSPSFSISFLKAKELEQNLVVAPCTEMWLRMHRVPPISPSAKKQRNTFSDSVSIVWCGTLTKCHSDEGRSPLRFNPRGPFGSAAVWKTAAHEHCTAWVTSRKGPQEPRAQISPAQILSGSSLLCNWVYFPQEAGIHTEDKASHRDILCAGYLTSGRPSSALLVRVEDVVLCLHNSMARVSTV
jgi:hypothetical protein